MSVNITTKYHSEDNTLSIFLIKENRDFDLFWINNPTDSTLIKTCTKEIESVVNNMTDEFMNNVLMIREGDDGRLDIAYELLGYLGII